MSPSFRLIAALCLFWLLAPREAFAAPWTAEPGLLPPAQAARLHARHKDVATPEDLEVLLRDIDRIVPVARLEARREGAGWQIYGKRAKVVKDLELDLTGRTLSNPLFAAVQSYVGHVDSAEIRGKIQEAALRYLKRRGYPNAKLKLKSEDKDDGVIYLVDVNEGNPCVLSKIELGFRLPPKIRLDLKPGDLCDRDDIEAKTSALELELRDAGYNQLKIEASELAYDESMDTARVYVTGILGQRVRYEIVDSAKRFLIDDIFADEELTKVDPTIVGPDAMGAELARRYRSRGFSDVVIKGPEVRKVGEDEFVYVYNVDPGKQYILKSVSFEGVTVFTEEELLDTMSLKSLWQTSRPLNLEEMQQGLNSLRGKYQEKGYWDAKVRDPGTGQKDKETGTVRLAIQVEEGLQRILKSIDVKGAANISAADIEELLQTPIDGPLDRARLVDFQQDVRAAYQAQGFLYADVKIDLKASEVKRRVMVDVTVTVQEGTRVKIGDVLIVGLTVTEEKVARRELLFKTGDWYEPERIALSRQALTRLGLFRSVQIFPTDRNAVNDKEALLDLTVDVREGKPGSVSFGPGGSLYRGWNYEAEASYTNFGGVNRQASVRGSISEERNQEPIGDKTLVGRKIGAGYVEPWIFDLPIDMVISTSQKAEWGRDLWELSTAGEVAFQHKFREWIPDAFVAVFYGQKIAKTEGFAEREDELYATDVRIGQTGVRFGIDKRDNVRFPSSGFTFDHEFAWARYGLGGDLRFFRWDVSTSHYYGILDDLVAALNMSVASYDGIQRKSGDLIGILPVSERLFAGGIDTVRGFRPRTLGPVARSPVFNYTAKSTDPVTQVTTPEKCTVGSYTNNVLDGSSRTVIKTELRYRVTDATAVTGFVDSGAVFFSQDQMAKFQTAYRDPVDHEQDACDALQQHRSVEDNIGYDYSSLVRNPGYLWSRHYYSYGAAFSLLTALGSVNLAYGLPWREPTTDACANDPEYCYRRGKSKGHWITRGEFSLDVGARF